MHQPQHGGTRPASDVCTVSPSPYYASPEACNSSLAVSSSFCTSASDSCVYLTLSSTWCGEGWGSDSKRETVYYFGAVSGKVSLFRTCTTGTERAVGEQKSCGPRSGFLGQFGCRKCGFHDKNESRCLREAILSCPPFNWNSIDFKSVRLRRRRPQTDASIYFFVWRRTPLGTDNHPPPRLRSGTFESGHENLHVRGS